MLDLFEDKTTPDPSRNWCDKEGALALKAKIEAHWRERGHAVQVWIEEKPFSTAMRGTHWVVRSNLCGGLPSPQQIERAA